MNLMIGYSMESGRTKRENGGERFSFFLATDFCFVYEWMG